MDDRARRGRVQREVTSNHSTVARGVCVRERTCVYLYSCIFAPTLRSRLAEEGEGKAEPDALQRLVSLCSCVLLCDTQREEAL